MGQKSKLLYYVIDISNADLFICLIVFFIYCVCLISVCYFFHLCCATTYDGEIKLYIIVLTSPVQDLKVGNAYSTSVVKYSMLHTFRTSCLRS